MNRVSMTIVVKIAGELDLIITPVRFSFGIAGHAPEFSGAERDQSFVLISNNPAELFPDSEIA